jgi:hypothetical protein
MVTDHCVAMNAHLIEPSHVYHAITWQWTSLLALSPHVNTFDIASGDLASDLETYFSLSHLSQMHSVI